MNRYGRAITIYLADGTSTGIRSAQLANWTGHALMCPRSAVARLKDWEEAKRPGVYWLFGEEDDAPAAYVGEAEDVLVRLADHLKSKEFWTEVILFTSKDDNLTKAHIRYLEKRFHEQASEAKRYRLVNRNQPGGASLPRHDHAAMEEFLDNARLLLGTLGHRPQEPVDGGAARPETDDNPEFTLSYGGVQATGRLVEEGFVVLRGSGFRGESTSSISKGSQKRRAQLIERGIVAPHGDGHVFAHDHVFSSPSAAAESVGGASLSGPALWKTKRGECLKDWQTRIAEAVKAEAAAPHESKS